MSPKPDKKQKKRKAREMSGRRVIVHLGLPKTGTTFLQASLEQHRDALRTAGIQYPAGEGRMFLAALDVRGTHDGWGRSLKETKGAWKVLVDLARRYDGDTVISHELLAAAPRDRIEATIGLLDGFEVHLVVTARDLARQAVAEWQEGIKHGRRLSFATFTRKVLAADADTEHAQRFRASQDLPGVLARWADVVPPERMHVVTCPPRGTPPDVLWSRFGEAIGIDTDRFGPAGQGNANGSLGSNEIDLLRKVNKALDHRIAQPAYGQVVKELYAQGLLAREQSPRPSMPQELYPDLVVAGERWAKEVDAAGYRVHGDLIDLLAVPPAMPAPHPDLVDPAAQVAAAARATADLLVEVATGRAEIARLTADNDKLRRKRKILRRKLDAARAD